jgi:hypothetical protein
VLCHRNSREYWQLLARAVCDMCHVRTCRPKGTSQKADFLPDSEYCVPGTEIGSRAQKPPNKVATLLCMQIHTRRKGTRTSAECDRTPLLLSCPQPTNGGRLRRARELRVIRAAAPRDLPLAQTLTMLPTTVVRTPCHSPRLAAPPPTGGRKAWLAGTKECQQLHSKRTA